MDREMFSQLHEATLHLLERVGVRVESPLARKLCAEAGLRVEEAAQRVYLEERQVQGALQSAPRAFALYGRHGGEPPLLIGGEAVYVMAGGASVRVYTLEGRYAPATWEHLRQFNTLLDALPHIHVLLNQVDPQEEAGGNYYRRLAAEMFLGTAKPCCLQAGDAADLRAMIAMGVVLRGSPEALAAKPVFMTGSNAEPPLCIPAHAAEILIEAARAGVPVGLGDYVMMGSTAPITVAGALAQRNATQLMALVLSQIARPGAPFYYAAESGSTDMRTLDPVMANPHALQVLRGAVELGRAYGLPVMGLATTDAKLPDPQAACQMTATFQLAVEAGAHLVQGPTSMMDQMMLSSFAQAIIDHDMVGYVLAAARRLRVTEETLALRAIEEVAQGGEYGALKFAMHPHTLEHLRAETWQPLAFSSETFAAWQGRGSPTVLARAEAAAKEILARHRPEPLDAERAEAIRRLAETAC
jgi:trimethylamine--corrinoid protein Co-methyltransferase